MYTKNSKLWQLFKDGAGGKEYSLMAQVHGVEVADGQHAIADIRVDGINAMSATVSHRVFQLSRGPGNPGWLQWASTIGAGSVGVSSSSIRTP